MVGRDYTTAESVLPDLLNTATAGWMVKTTADNLELIYNLRREREDTHSLQAAMIQLKKCAAQLPGA